MSGRRINDIYLLKFSRFYTPRLIWELLVCFLMLLFHFSSDLIRYLLFCSAFSAFYLQALSANLPTFVLDGSTLTITLPSEEVG